MRVVIVSLLAAVALAIATQPLVAQRIDTTVHLAGAPLYARVAKLVKEVSIGVASGRDEYIFSRITNVAVARDGSIYVYDSPPSALRKYDASGQYVRTFGGRGQGPGEYMGSGGLAVAPDGRVLLWDSRSARVNVYTPDGTSLAPFKLRVTGNPSNSFILDTAGRVHIQQFRRGNPPVLMWRRFRPDSTPPDTLFTPPIANNPPWLTSTASEGSSVTTSVPFAAYGWSALSPFGYLITGRPDRYAIEVHADPAKPILSIRRNIPPVPVPNRVRDSARTATTEQIRRGQPGWTWNAPDIPTTKPFYWIFQVADDGRIWVMLDPVRDGKTPAMSPAQAGLFDVFEATGQYLGQVEIPATVVIHARRGDKVWGVETGADDIPRVVRFRIAWQ